MNSHTSKGKGSSSTSDTSVSHSPVTAKEVHQIPTSVPDQKHVWKSRRHVHTPRIMFLDPSDDPLSDAESFDKDDMYGSDSGVETISLRSGSKEQDQQLNECMVCTCPD